MKAYIMNRGRGVWSARGGAHLACYRGRYFRGEEPLVGCHRHYHCGPLSLGLTSAQANAALVTTESAEQFVGCTK